MKFDSYGREVTNSSQSVCNLDAAAGRIPGVSAVNKFGNNPTLATSTTETVWGGSSLYTFPATADIT